jgi:hypothetical protein
MTAQPPALAKWHMHNEKPTAAHAGLHMNKQNARLVGIKKVPVDVPRAVPWQCSPCIYQGSNAQTNTHVSLQMHAYSPEALRTEATNMPLSNQ